MEYLFRGKVTLVTLLVELAHSNDISLKKVHLWPNIPALKLDKMARKIPVEDVQTFVDGEDTEAQAIAEKHGAEELHQFLNDCFNGKIAVFTD